MVHPENLVVDHSFDQVEHPQSTIIQTIFVERMVDVVLR